MCVWERENSCVLPTQSNKRQWRGKGQVTRGKGRVRGMGPEKMGREQDFSSREKLIIRIIPLHLEGPPPPLGGGPLHLEGDVDILFLYVGFKGKYPLHF